MLNGKYGDADICNTFTHTYFQSIYKPNTPDADSQYKTQVQDILADKAADVKS